MSELENKNIQEQILDLQIEVRHLSNELRLTKEEYEDSARKYFDVFYNLDQKVKERTAALERANQELTKEIFERKRAEQEKSRLESQIRQTQKLESIGTLAGGIAHDFNNMLVAIIGFSEMARDGLPVESLAREDLDQVLVAAKRARDLIKHILTFSRQDVQELKPFQLHLVVKEAMKMMRAAIPSTIEIRSNIDSTAVIMGDPTQIHQVLINLCTNATHAMEEKGGELEVGIHAVNLGAEDLINEKEMEPGSYVMLTVRDTGYGMDKGHMRRIFDPYFTTKEFGKGSGMGLAVVHGIVKSHGGMIVVDSEPGKGAVFKVFFPQIRQEDIIERGGADILPIGTESILFVDDELAGITIGKRTLEFLGYKVTARTSSVEALEAFRAQPDKFDLVITDQTMPNMTGLELAREILEIRPEMPILLCTGYSSLLSEEKFRASGIRGFAMKPLVRQELAEKVRAVLDGSGN